MTDDAQTVATKHEVTAEKKNLVLLVYVLQAASFLVGITAIAGVIINYIKRDEVRGTWLESHVSWQIKTFWYTLAGCIVSAILTVVVIGFLGLFLVSVWYLYRIIKGWLALNDSKALADAFF